MLRKLKFRDSEKHKCEISFGINQLEKFLFSKVLENKFYNSLFNYLNDIFRLSARSGLSVCQHDNFKKKMVIDLNL